MTEQEQQQTGSGDYFNDQVLEEIFTNLENESTDKQKRFNRVANFLCRNRDFSIGLGTGLFVGGISMVVVSGIGPVHDGQLLEGAFGGAMAFGGMYSLYHGVESDYQAPANSEDSSQGAQP